MRLVSLAGFFLIIPGCYGQSGKAELFGTVRDPSDLPVSNAEVTAQDVGTNAQFTAATNDRGDYHLLGLAAGSYLLIVDKAGFREYRQAGVQLRIGDQVSQDVRLSVGELSQAIEVHGEASPLQTASGSVDFGVDENRVVT
jgi:hypothetical protein